MSRRASWFLHVAKDPLESPFLAIRAVDIQNYTYIYESVFKAVDEIMKS